MSINDQSSTERYGSKKLEYSRAHGGPQQDAQSQRKQFLNKHKIGGAEFNDYNFVAADMDALGIERLNSIIKESIMRNANTGSRASRAQSKVGSMASRQEANLFTKISD